jgi:hypothetical protein
MNTYSYLSLDPGENENNITRCSICAMKMERQAPLLANSYGQGHCKRLQTSCLYADGIMVRNLHNLVGQYVSIETAKHSGSWYTLKKLSNQKKSSVYGIKFGSCIYTVKTMETRHDFHRQMGILLSFAQMCSRYEQLFITDIRKVR